MVFLVLSILFSAFLIAPFLTVLCLHIPLNVLTGVGISSVFVSAYLYHRFLLNPQRIIRTISFYSIVYCLLVPLISLHRLPMETPDSQAIFNAVTYSPIVGILIFIHSICIAIFLKSKYTSK